MSGWGEEIHLVKPGMFVTVILKSGKKVKGEVVDVTPEAIELGRDSNYGWKTDRYSAEDIERIEFGKPTGGANFFAGMMVGVAVMFSILMIGLAMSGPINLS